MAALQNRNGSFRVIFRYENRQHSVPVGKVPQGEAESFLGKVEHLLLRIEQGWVSVPAGVTITDFILADGQVKTPEVVVPKEPATFGEFEQKYLDAHRSGAMEANSLATAAMHLGHFKKTLGEGFVVEKLTQADLQRHVNRRGKKQYRGKSLAPRHPPQGDGHPPRRVERGGGDWPGEGGVPQQGAGLPQERREAAVHDLAGGREECRCPWPVGAGEGGPMGLCQAVRRPESVCVTRRREAERTPAT